MLRDTYVEINLDHIAFNIKNIRATINDKTKIAAVIKANAYGHGAVEVAKCVMENGADLVAVATLTEALELRIHYADYDIFIMGYTPSIYLDVVARNDFIQCIFSLEQAIILSELGDTTGKPVRVHIKYDTGFNRLGFKDSPESIQCIQKIIQLKSLEVEGIFSHLALAGHEENQNQFNRLKQAIDQIENNTFKFKYKHICDSISAIDYPEFNLDMIRPGAIIYGMKSFRKNDIELKSTLSFKTKIYHLKEIDEGDGVSYNYKWKAKKQSKIATIPVGYSDGLPRSMTDVGMVTIHDVRVPIIGVICMDQCMVDVSELDEVAVGDDVVIYGDGTNNSITIEEASEIAGTNKNEILSRITRRTPRVYIEDGKVKKIVNYLLEG